MPDDRHEGQRVSRRSLIRGITSGFTTIWPGWYRGRTVHIHVMVHVSNKRDGWLGAIALGVDN